ncbi:MAG: glutamine--fructose-6-phosphate transaminase (isomerizing), partial [Planctomycetes bacterium]|nr:glutamine--fructose-6-phosphate transaminase (isomerizing) [Planctomycetota bacterium]
VLAHLIALFHEDDLEQAVRAALQEVQGTYGLAVVSADQPDVLVAARNGSPLIVGVGDGEYVVASDASAIVEHTTQAIYLGDNEMCVMTRNGFHTTTLDAAPVTKPIHDVEFSLEQIELGGHEHFMLKEIVEQPEAIRMCLRGRIDRREGRVHLGGIAAYGRELVQARRVIFSACGTAWHAGLIGEYLFEDLARVPAETEYASEFRYRNPVINNGTVVIALSQSGETADTLAALREARDRGALALGIVNVVGSSIARETDAGIYLHVGPEIGVASTKAFTGQVMVLALLSLYLARRRHMSRERCEWMLAELASVPDKMERVLEQADHVREVTLKYVERENWLFLGRGYNYPTALEGALKLKEISYIHAEGMPAAEMKHGPIALIDDGMPAVFIATKGSQYDKVINNIEEVRSRGGHVIAVATEGDTEIAQHARDVLFIPDIAEPLSPILAVVPLQLMAYEAAVARGHDVDRPRNLAKSVTVE